MKSQRSLPKARKFFWCGLGLAASASAYMIQRRRKAARAADWNRKLTSGEVRTALVTGASSGIGHAYARALAAQGFNVMLVARRQERLEELAEKIRQKNGVVAEVLVADLSTNMGIARVEERISERGDIDFLVNNAGYDEPGSFPKIPIEKTLGLINCLMLASVRLSRAALPGMLARRCGAIVNVSSIGAFGPKPRDSTYVASKAYINLFSESLSIELAGSGIHVQALCPGFTLTEFHDAPLYAQYHVKERIPGWLWMTPEAVVEKSLQALGEDRRVCIPGLKNQLITTAARSGLSALLLGVLRSFFSQGAGMTPGGRNTWVEHWGRFASSYEEKVRYVTGTETFELLSQKLQEQGLLGDTLDLGCGTGKYTAIIAPLSRKVVAVDLSPDLLAVAQEKLAGQPNVEFQLADAEKLDFPPASFDTVLMANVLPILNAPKVLGEVARLLRPGGKLLAAHFTLNGMALPDRAGFALRSFSTFGLPPRGRKDYSPSELASLVRQASFRLEEAGLIGREVKAVWLRACKDGVAQPDPLTVLACPASANSSSASASQ